MSLGSSQWVSEIVWDMFARGMTYEAHSRVFGERGSFENWLLVLCVLDWVFHATFGNVLSGAIRPENLKH